MTSEVSAQTKTEEATSSIDIENYEDVEQQKQIEANWLFLSMDDEKVIYIDFEKIDATVSDVMLEQDGEMVFLDNVLTLPSDSIYELDMDEFGSGKFTLKLRSFKCVYSHEIESK